MIPFYCQIHLTSCSQHRICLAFDFLPPFVCCRHPPGLSPLPIHPPDYCLGALSHPMRVAKDDVERNPEDGWRTEEKEKRLEGGVTIPPAPRLPRISLGCTILGNFSGLVLGPVVPPMVPAFLPQHYPPSLLLHILFLSLSVSVCQSHSQMQHLPLSSLGCCPSLCYSLGAPCTCPVCKSGKHT